MAGSQSSLIHTLYAPALVGNDGRARAIVHVMERAQPGLRLEWTISDEGEFIPLPRRDVWLTQERPDGGFLLVCNGDERYLVTLTGWERPAGISPGGQPQFEVHAQLPLDPAGIGAAAGMLEGLAESARAFWGHASPDILAAEFARQTRHSANEPHVPPRGLPSIKLPEALSSPEIPQVLGWVNYWSAAAARILGFPDPARDADLLSRSRRTATGGWVVQLTQAPLDLDSPAHLEALLRAYERFPEIGGRAAR